MAVAQAGDVRLLSVMTTLSPFRLACLCGCGTEAVLIGLFAVSGGIGPCGPADDLGGFIFLAHLPGILLASHLGSEWLAVAVIVATSAVILTTAYYGLIHVWRLVKRRPAA